MYYDIMIYNMYYDIIILKHTLIQIINPENLSTLVSHSGFIVLIFIIIKLYKTDVILYLTWDRLHNM